MRALAAALALLLACSPLTAAPVRQPNFLVIVADDLGFSDIGAFGGEIETPNLDALAKRSLRLTGFHTAPACSPTRAMLLTGVDSHEAGLGGMAELLAPNQVGHPGYEGALRPDTASLAELLAAGGYRTHFSGKWHLGTKPDQDPHARGFQTSFAMLRGAHNHFNVTVPGAIESITGEYSENGRRIADLPAGFYSSDYFASRLIDQLDAGRRGAGGKRPFFAYLAFTAPHFPLQAPPETIARYKGRYDAGYDVLRARRLRRQVALGLLAPRTPAHEPDLAPAWATLPPAEKALAARRMEVFAAMVDRLDWNVGRVLAALKKSGELDDTVILFLSDNGAEGGRVSDPSMKPLHAFLAGVDNSLGNIGAATSYDAIGPGWASAATAPDWRFKVYPSEGGTRAVSFLAGPGIRPGTRPDYVHVMDVTPTFLELAGVAAPGTRFAGREVKPIRGHSWAAWLGGRAEHVYSPDEPVGTELFGGRSLRRGDWKVTDMGDGRWRLFNVARDPGETRDLSSADPTRKAALLRAWDRYAADVGVVLPAPVPVIIDRPLEREGGAPPSPRR